MGNMFYDDDDGERMSYGPPPAALPDIVDENGLVASGCGGSYVWKRLRDDGFPESNLGTHEFWLKENTGYLPTSEKYWGDIHIGDQGKAAIAPLIELAQSIVAGELVGYHNEIGFRMVPVYRHAGMLWEYSERGHTLMTKRFEWLFADLPNCHVCGEDVFYQGVKVGKANPLVKGYVYDAGRKLLRPAKVKMFPKEGK